MIIPVSQITTQAEENKTKDINFYLPLYRAALNGDWDSAKAFFSRHPEAFTANITALSETALHIAVGTGKKAINFVEKMVELMPIDTLGQLDSNNETVLATAAIVGNLEAAKLLVNKNPHLPHIWGKSAKSPLHRAAQYGQKEMVSYLLTVTKATVGENPYVGAYGISLLELMIFAGFYDIALVLVHRYPNLVMLKTVKGDSPLAMIAGKPSAFLSGSHLNFWQRLLYSCVAVKLKKLSRYSNARDLENQLENSRVVHEQMCRWARFLRACCDLYAKLWEFIGRFVPPIKHMQETKLMHGQALQLVKRICMEIAGLDYKSVEGALKRPLHLAAEMGIHEVVVEIVKSFPAAIWFTYEKQDVFQLAVLNRHQKVFSLIYHVGDYGQLVIKYKDRFNNNILHLAGKLAPSHQLSLVSGAALQMQRELQWFKEVEKFVEPAYKEMKNIHGQTPEMVFTEEHKKLVKEGEEWIKGTATSCTLAASLIATVVFAGAITVPGGNNSNGLPIFSQERAFVIFVISDASSLFSSVASVLMFLSILTSRYAHMDFLYALPNRLIIGLVALFLSISSMMLAFTAALYLVIGQTRAWILITVGVLAGVPVTLFVLLQFPLLWKMIYSTYGRGIFTKRSKHIIY